MSFPFAGRPKATQSARHRQKGPLAVFRHPASVYRLVGQGHEYRKNAEAAWLGGPEIQGQQIRSAPAVSSETLPLVLAIY
jgi:hypothetical protein